MEYSDYPRIVVEDIARLRRRLDAARLPAKTTDSNLIIGTWNIRMFGSVCPAFDELPNAPKRTWRSLASIAEVISRFDIVAIQEVKRDTSGIRLLLEWLGPDWGLIITDVCSGDGGNDERLAFLYDRRRVTPSGLAGEIVLPPTEIGNPVLQFARPPYLVGFRAAEEQFVLLTAHIKYGDIPADRLPELTALAKYISKELRNRASEGMREEKNLIVLGDFNIDERGENPLFKEFVSTGLVVPAPLNGLRTAFGTKPKYYDQIAWFMGSMDMPFKDAGVIDFAGAVYSEITLQKMSYRISDHLPLWAEFSIDRSVEKMAKILGVDPAMPDPLSVVP